MCARPISSSRALLRVRTREPTHRKRLAPGVLAILLAIDRCRPIIKRCQSSFLTVQRYDPWMHYNMCSNSSSPDYDDYYTSRDACLFDDEYD